MSTQVLPRNTVIVGDARESLAGLPDASVDTVITSPPYFQLRNYGVDRQIGLEADVTEWVEALRAVGRELARVITPTGSWWLNVADSFSKGGAAGAPAKSLLLAPERLALALLEDGWIVRGRVCWQKNNAMPASVRDRLACSWEFVYHLVRMPSYAFDLDAIRVPHRSSQTGRHRTGAVQASYPPDHTEPPRWAGPLASGSNSGLARLKANGLVGHRLGANPRDVWTMATANFRGEHFATFPPRLVERPLLATCPERVCARCDAPWAREPARVLGHLAVRGDLRRTCRCRAGARPGLVLDPFFGAGTVGLVAERHGRDWLGIELNPRFAALATKRIATARGQPEEERHVA
jgi:DNA modification methylase